MLKPIPSAAVARASQRLRSANSSARKRFGAAQLKLEPAWQVGTSWSCSCSPSFCANAASPGAEPTLACPPAPLCCLACSSPWATAVEPTADWEADTIVDCPASPCAGTSTKCMKRKPRSSAGRTSNSLQPYCRAVDSVDFLTNATVDTHVSAGERLCYVSHYCVHRYAGRDAAWRGCCADVTAGTCPSVSPGVGTTERYTTNSSRERSACVSRVEDLFRWNALHGGGSGTPLPGRCPAGATRPAYRSASSAFTTTSVPSAFADTTSGWVYKIRSGWRTPVTTSDSL